MEVLPAKWVGMEYRKKYMRRYKGKCDIFFGTEHRLRKEEMEEQFNKEAKEGRRFAADAARITGERAGSEDRKHTSGGVFVAVDSNLEGSLGRRRRSDYFNPRQRRKNRPSMGKMCEEVCVSFRCTSGARKAGPRGMRLCLRQL